jgi:hypothetical protein
MTSSAEPRFAVPEHVHFRHFDQEIVLLDLAGGKYFALDEVGAEVWRRLADGKSVDQIAADLVTLFDTDETTARADVASLLGELAAAGLIKPLR